MRRRAPGSLATALYEFMILDVGLSRRRRAGAVPRVFAPKASLPDPALEPRRHRRRHHRRSEIGRQRLRDPKPFRFAVLMARVHALLRSMAAGEEAMLFASGLIFSAPAPATARCRLEENPPDGKGNQHPQISLSLRRHGAARNAVARGLGLQSRGDHPHAGDPYLSLAPEDRAEPGEARILVTESGGYRLMT